MGWLYSNKWAAGFFDGEGNVYLRLRVKHRAADVYVQVTQKDISPLLELKKVWGGSVTDTKTPSGCHRWRAGHKKAEAFLRAIYPHCLVKHEAISRALQERAKVRPYRARKA